MKVQWKNRVKEIKRMMKKMSDEEIAAHYGIKKHRFMDARKRMGLMRDTDITYRIWERPIKAKGGYINWDFSGMDIHV